MPPDIIRNRSQILLNYFLRRNLNLWDAEDLVQDVMLKILRMQHHPDQLDQAYLYTVARTLMIDKFREATRHKASAHVAYPQDELYCDASHNPDFQVEEQRLLESFYNLLLQLTELQRNTFIENKLEGVGLQEIAHKREVSLSAVEKVASKANHSVLELFVEGECA